MTKQVITFGTPPTGIGGDSYRTAFGKCNENFTEVYDKIAYFDGAPKPASSFTIYRDVLSNYRATATLTGALVIHLPRAKNKSATLLSLRIRGYNYLGNKGEWDLQVGGYNYTSGWVQCSANLNGPAPFTQVQLGMASDHQVIIIGTTSTVWAYPRFNIEELSAGYSNHEAGWNTGLSVEYETNLSAYTGLVTPVLYGWPQVLTAEKLTTPRTIGGVSFDGSANINLPGVNTTGNQSTSGNAATASKLQTARTVTVGSTGKTFDGSANVAYTVNEILPTATSGQFLKFDGTNWVAAADNNTTYSEMSQAEANTGTATTSRVITAAVLKGAIQTHAPVQTSVTGNAATATTLATARTINGTSFNGSANITTANWGTARTLTIGSTGKSVDGSANVSWTLAEIGAAAASHTHAYLPTSGGTLSGNLSVTGTITATGNITAFSDARLKDNITKIPDALNKLNQLKGVTYTRKDLASDTQYAGLIAQDVQKVLPEAVLVTEDDIIAVDYNGVIGLLVEAIKELESKVAKLEGK